MLRVSANQQEMEEYRERLRSEENQRLLASRKEIVEHPFGTLKRTLGYTYFLLKGLEKVTAEFNLMCFAYNLKRVFNIVGFQKMMAAIQKPIEADRSENSAILRVAGFWSEKGLRISTFGAQSGLKSKRSAAVFTQSERWWWEDSRDCQEAGASCVSAAQVMPGVMRTTK